MIFACGLFNALDFCSTLEQICPDDVTLWKIVGNRNRKCWKFLDKIQTSEDKWVVMMLTKFCIFCFAHI